MQLSLEMENFFRFETYCKLFFLIIKKLILLRVLNFVYIKFVKNTKQRNIDEKS